MSRNATSTAKILPFQRQEVHEDSSHAPAQEKLKELGLKEGARILQLAPRLAGSDISREVGEKIAFFKRLGFKRPERMIDVRPAILFIDREALSSKIQALKVLGFRDPVKMIEKFPTLAGYDVAGNVVPKLECLRSLGFHDPVRVVESLPSIVGVNLVERAAPQLERLKELGFADPIRLVEKYPILIYLNIEDKVIPQMHYLKAKGFLDPVKMIERHPGIVGLSRERNITPTLEELLAWGYTHAQIESRPSLIASSISRMRSLREWLAARGVDAAGLPAGLKRKAVISLRDSDLQSNLEERGVSGEADLRQTLKDSGNWTWIFAKAG